MMMQTLVPIGFVFFLLAVFIVHMTYRRARRVVTSQENLEKHDKATTGLVGKYVTMFFLLTYLVLPSVTTTIARSIPCVSVDPDNVYPDQYNYYLRNDLSIRCDSPRYKFGIAWASVMFIIYPFGIPFLYFWVLYHNRHSILRIKEAEEAIRKEEEEREKAGLSSRRTRKGAGFGAMVGMGFGMNATQGATVAGTGKDEEEAGAAVHHGVDEENRTGVMKYITPDAIKFLHKAYEGQFWYWEIVETLRRLLLTAVVSIVATGKLCSRTNNKFCGINIIMYTDNRIYDTEL
jgi:hypothetical protein